MSILRKGTIALCTIILSASTTWAQFHPPLAIQDDGGSVSRPVNTINSTDGIVCTHNGFTGTCRAEFVTSGSDGDSSTSQSDSGLEFVAGAITLLRGCSDNEILKWDNTLGKWQCQADSGGDSSGSTGLARVDSGTWSYAELSGDVSTSGSNSVSVNEVQTGAISEAGDIDNDIITHAQIADSDQADTKCIWFEDPTADDDFKSIWANKTANDFLLTEIWAESDQTVNFDLQVDDGTPADVNGTDISPSAGEAEDTTLSGDTTVAAGEELDLAITSVSGTPTYVSICFTGNWVDG